MRCYHCDQPLTSGDHFCPHCGALTEAPQQAQAQQPQQMVCPACRAAVPPGSSFCPVCGAALRAGVIPPMPVGPAPQPAQGSLGGLSGLGGVGGVPNWGKVALGGVGGLMLGSLLGGHRGGLDWGGDDRDGGGWGGDGDGGDWGGDDGGD